MNPHVRAAIDAGRTCDVTTTGRRSGAPRRIEIWYFVVSGQVYLTGTPGPRDWLANLRADPTMTFHVKEGAHADLPAHGIEVADAAERRRVMAHIRDTESWYVDQGHSVEEWIAASPLARVDFTPSR